MRRKLLTWNNKENLEQGQKIQKQTEHLEPDKSTVFNFIPKYLFFCPKGCDFCSISLLNENHKNFLPRDQTMKPHIFQWFWVWVWTNFLLGFNTFSLVHPYCKMCMVFLSFSLCGTYLECRSIWKSLSWFFSWLSVLKTLLVKSLLPENWWVTLFVDKEWCQILSYVSSVSSFVLQQ